MKLLITLACLAALALCAFLSLPARAQSQFRQKIRHVEIHGDAWRLDDGSVVSAFNCIADEQQPMLDGGTWPLKHRIAFADGGLPNPVLNSCAAILEGKNALDGGLQ